MLDAEDPSFATDFEPPELRQRGCALCGAARATIECTLCNQVLCGACERRAHERLLIRYAQWSQEFVEMAKMSRRMKLQELEQQQQAKSAAAVAAAEADLRIKHEVTRQQQPSVPTTSTMKTQHKSVPETPAVPQPVLDAVRVKAERVNADGVQQSTEPITDLQALSIIEPAAVAAEAPPVAAPPVKQELRPSVAPELQRGHTSHFVVDLTDDDDMQDTSVKSEQQHLALQDVPIKAETSAWLASVASPPPSSGVAVGNGTRSDALAEDDFGSFTDGDPIMTTMISEYNRLSESIFNLESEILAVQVKLKELVAKPDYDMNEVVRYSATINQVKNNLVKETHKRNAVVARLVIYLKQDPTELKVLFEDAGATDIAHVQASSHRKCARFEASIRAKHVETRQLKRGIEEAINMKSKDAYAEVARLGAMVVTSENAIRELEDARLAEFLLLFQFSLQIRNAARTMANIQGP
uniref:B box-type domain-containing protein n=1 Tax=Globisporangium ultimum (strain ATCC 200006 / CBS 805.95 / DAOM BR144) TaxID=431595 RepID=K3XBS2_GLOUD